MTESERAVKSQMTQSIQAELARTHPDVKITSKYPVTKVDANKVEYDALYGERGGQTVLVLHRQSDCTLKVTSHLENYKNV